MTMEYRTESSDWNTLTAAITEDEYRLADLDIRGHAVDVGGHLGSVGLGLAIDHPGLTVTIVEPVPDNVDLIHTNIGLNGLESRVTVLYGAVGPKDRETTRVHYGFRGNESAEHHAFIGNIRFVMGGSDCPEFTPHEHAEVKVYHLEDLLPADFIKIDCEGGEWPFMADAPTDQIPMWVGEWHPIPGHNDGAREKGSTQAEFAALLPAFDITWRGPLEGTQDFWAVRR